MPHSPLTRTLYAAATVSLCMLSGCSQGHYKKWADREVFGIIGKKSQFVAGSEDDTLLSITPPAPVKLDTLIKSAETAEFLGDRAFIEKGARVVSLADALDFAVHRNRTYLSRKELVYLSALTLTLTRQQYGPIVDSSGSAGYSDVQVQNGVNRIVRNSTLATGGAVTFDYLMKTGARLAVDLTTDFTRFFTGDVRGLSDSRAAVSLTQPLLRGAGVLATVEPLRQDERDVLYAIRDFTQYRKTFTVGIATQYFRVVQAREAARNRFVAYRAALVSIERETALAAANLRSQSSLKQIQQGRITYERNWINAIRTYEEQLDDLKISLGLPVNERVVLAKDELQKLQVTDPQGTLDQVLDTALITRLDIYNERDRVQDTSRKVKIAHQQTLPTLNALVGYQVGSPVNSQGLQVSTDQRSIAAGVDVDLNLNVKPERNQLRAAQIAEQSAQRELELAEEQLRSTIRSDWRGLEVARKQYDLAQQGLALAQKRLEIEEALMEEGQGTARDIVESQDRLIVARDLVVSTLIDHVIARLQLWSDMGVLYIEKDGSWVDVLNKEKPKGES
ncbi:outer membrane protein TolC [Prosthecobacter fusiformis]|uniref:Outer membrane protein TolC n=1 Tax=Prosthecobacter fusiformis TaxID=48464 RepID=A0A4R7RKC8_9BACT|nr:TolC family protein [Prosthecobacter fusiformis]TDU63212.1 outer membrane protein TolC [Prosthecobacter fusiformis]